MDHGGRQEPVTVSINRYVRPGREADYGNRVHGVAAAVARFPGFLGVNVLCTGAGSRGFSFKGSVYEQSRNRKIH